MLVGELRSENVIKFLQSVRREVKLAASFAVGAMAAKAKGHCRDMLSLTDHTQADLDKLDHPYAKRHGVEGAGLHDPYQQVHEQTGALIAGLDIVPPHVTSTGATASVRNADEKDTMIQIGTRTMIGRPYMAYVRNEFAEDISAAGAAEFERRLARLQR